MNVKIFRNEDAGTAGIMEHTNANPVEPDVFTSLFMAAQNGNLEVVKALVQAGASIDLCRSSGVIPLSVAAYNGHSEIIEILIDSNANINTIDVAGHRPAAYAEQKLTRCTQKPSIPPISMGLEYNEEEFRYRYSLVLLQSDQENFENSNTAVLQKAFSRYKTEKVAFFDEVNKIFDECGLTMILIAYWTNFPKCIVIPPQRLIKHLIPQD